ncbi:MAG: hypothetical protein OIF47_13845 [Marinibacterium sp.]|nr:hypothetical protein [Marinibacterium sp.]
MVPVEVTSFAAIRDAAAAWWDEHHLMPVGQRHFGVIQSCYCDPAG